MAKEKTFEELVALAVKALESGRPQKAVRNLVDDAASAGSSAVSAGSSAVSGAASAVKKALKKLKGEAKPPKVVAPKVASVAEAAKTAGAVPKVLTRAEQKAANRAANQIKDAERRAVQGGTPAERAALKAERKAKNRDAYKSKEKQIIDERYSPKSQRELGTPVLMNKTEKSLNAIEQKERLISNQGGSFDARVTKEFERMLKSITDDGYKLNKSEMKSLYASVKADIKEESGRNLSVMKENFADRMKNLNKLTPQEMDTEAGRLFFRQSSKQQEIGNKVLDTRNRAQILADKSVSDAAEAAAAAKASKARLAERGTGKERGPREPKPFVESESGLRLQAQQRENAAKTARQSRKDVELHNSKKIYTEEELKNTRIVEQSRAASDTAKSQKKTYEGMGDIKGEPLRYGQRGETLEQLNVRLAAHQAKVAKELKAKKASKAPKKK